MRWSIPFALLVLGGCDTRTEQAESTNVGAPPETAVVAQATPSLDTLSTDHTLADSALIERHGLLYEAGVRLGRNRTELQHSLGPSVRIDAREIENRHGAGRDSIFEISFRRAAARVIWAGYDGREFVIFTALWDPAHPLPGGLRIGRTTKSEITRLLGTPDEQRAVSDSALLDYEVGEYVSETIRLHVARDTLRGIEWLFYVD